MTIIHLIRHGEVHNPQKILYARLPRFRLSCTGQTQAEAAGAYLRERPLAAIYSSPRLRARQTARAVASYHNGLKVRQSRLLDEVHTPHEGRPIAELDTEGWQMFTGLPPGYDTPDTILARVQRLIDRVRRQHPEGEIVFVSHGDIVLSTHFWVQGTPFTDETKNAIAHYPATASVTTLTFANGYDLPQLSYHVPYQIADPA